MTLSDLECLSCVGVCRVLRDCTQLRWLDVTGCYHVSDTSLQTAIDVLEQQQQQAGVEERGDEDGDERGVGYVVGRELTVCVGGCQSVLDVTLPACLHVIDTSSPYDHWQLLADGQSLTHTHAHSSTLGDFTFWISLSLSLKTERKA